MRAFFNAKSQGRKDAKVFGSFYTTGIPKEPGFLSSLRPGVFASLRFFLTQGHKSAKTRGDLARVGGGVSPYRQSVERLTRAFFNAKSPGRKDAKIMFSQ